MSPSIHTCTQSVVGANEKGEVHVLPARKVTAEFIGEEYGAEYLQRKKGDLVVSVPHSDADEDWDYGAVVATGDSRNQPGAIEHVVFDMHPFGWFPVVCWKDASNIEMGYVYVDFLCANVGRPGFIFLATTPGQCC